MLLGIIRGLEALCDTIEYGPITALKINTSVCPEAERSYHQVMNGTLSSSSSIEAKKIGKNVDPLVQEYISITPDKAVINDTIKLITDTKTITDRCEAEIVIDKVTLHDVTNNISAAIHEFSVEADTDKQLITCFIMAYYKYNNRLIKSVLDNILKTDEDKNLYIGILRWFDSVEVGNPKKAGSMLLEDSVVKELKELLNWQLSYDSDHTSAAQALSIKKGFEDILKNLENLKEEIIVNPIVETVGKVIPKSGFTDDEKKDILKKLESDFAEILKDHKEGGLLTYKFNILSDIAELVILDKELAGPPAHYRIDPNVIIGNGTNLIYYVVEPDGVLRDIYVNISKRPEIVKNIIDNPGYNLTPEEVQQCFADYFTIKQIYYCIDMGSFSKYITSIKQSKLNTLERKLTAVYNVFNNGHGIPAARLRLKEWRGIDNFVLISDKDCRSPFMANGSTCGEIVPGMIVSVDKDEITVSYKDPTSKEMEEAKFTIRER